MSLLTLIELAKIKSDVREETGCELQRDAMMCDLINNTIAPAVFSAFSEAPSVS